MELSIRNLVIIVLAILALILGIVLLIQVFGLNKNLNVLPAPEKTSVKVAPASGVQGMQFLILARSTDKNLGSDLSLILENSNYSNILNLYDDGKHNDANASDGLYGGFFDSTNAPLGEYEIKSGDNILAFFDVERADYEVIQGKNDDRKINFVILPSNYTDYNDFKKDAINLIESKNSLLTTEPFSSNKDKFSFYILNSSVNCELNCNNVDTIVCCDTKKVLEEASKIHYDSIIVLVNSTEYCGSSSSYSKICAKNPEANKVLMHEVGHSFADLADEYVYSDYWNYNIGQINNANCAAAGCDKWKNLTGGCYEGCTYSNLYRPVSQNSIMYDLYPEFDSVCTNYIEEIIKEQRVKENEIEKSAPKKSYFVSLTYNKGQIEIGDIFLRTIKAGVDMKQSDYSIKINSGNKELFSTSLYVPRIEYPLNASPVVLDSVDFSIVIPYYKGDKLVIYNKEKPIAEKALPVITNQNNNSEISNKKINYKIILGIVLVVGSLLVILISWIRNKKSK